ncbi:MAG TPA: YchJ family metal-binding protein [Desulfopila sp.]|nr:YchJ family metal-binding protein [Desulfopila sp.]
MLTLFELNLHTEHHLAKTPEQLMRSRYSAFVKGNIGFILESWDIISSPDAIEMEEEILWLGVAGCGSFGHQDTYACDQN